MTSPLESRSGKTEGKDAVTEGMKVAIEQKNTNALLDALEKTIQRWGAGHGKLYVAIANEIDRHYPEGVKDADRLVVNLAKLAKDLRENADMLSRVMFPPGKQSGLEYMASLRRFYGTKA
jgi:hypothetical protein